MRTRSDAVEQHLKELGLICFAILMGVVVFGGVVWYLLNSGAFVPPDGLPGYLATLLNLVALIAILKAFFVPRLFPQPGPEAPEGGHLAWHKRNTILGFALREGGAFIALVGVLLTGEQVGGFAMASLAIVTMVLAWPRVDQLDLS